MKKLLFLLLITLSFSAFSQSYLVLTNCRVISFDNQGKAFDLNNCHFPAKTKPAGGRIFVFREDFVTVSKQGFVFKKDIEAPKEFEHTGLNYVIAKKGWFKQVIYTVNDEGFLYTLDMPDGVTKDIKAGGNYFVSIEEEDKKKASLYFVDPTGIVQKKATLPNGLRPFDITTTRGKYLFDRQGTIYTVADNGTVVPKNMFIPGKIIKFGGNFFINRSSFIFTITKDGYLYENELPDNLRVDQIQRVGSNYFVTTAGALYGISDTGLIIKDTYLDYDFKMTSHTSL